MTGLGSRHVVILKFSFIYQTLRKCLKCFLLTDVEVPALGVSNLLLALGVKDLMKMPFSVAAAADVFSEVLSASEGSVTKNSVSGVDGGLPANE